MPINSFIHTHNLDDLEISNCVRIWDNSCDLPDASTVRYLAIDTETEYIINGKPIVPVLMQVKYAFKDNPSEGIVDIIFAKDFESYLTLLKEKFYKTEFVFHTCPFDLAVMGLVPGHWLQEKLERGEITDISLRFVLKLLEDGDLLTEWNLAYISEKLLGWKLDKSDELRLQFFRDKEPTQEQIEYAVRDVVATSLIRDCLASKYPTEDIQVRGAVALDSISRNGMFVDLEYMRNLRRSFDAKTKEYLATLAMFGWQPSVKGNESILQEILANIEARTGLKFERTPTKTISTEDSSLVHTFEDAGLAPHPFIESYKEYKHLEKVMSTYLNEELLGADGRVHPRVTNALKTLRTSLSRPNLQNIPKLQGVRGVYKAPNGFCLASVDYSQLELCALAEDCIHSYGFSKMGEIINSGVDLHGVFGKEIAKFEGKDPTTLSKEEFKYYRQLAKISGFGSSITNYR